MDATLDGAIANQGISEATVERITKLAHDATQNGVSGELVTC